MNKHNVKLGERVQILEHPDYWIVGSIGEVVGFSRYGNPIILAPSKDSIRGLEHDIYIAIEPPWYKKTTKKFKFCPECPHKDLRDLASKGRIL